MQTDTPATSPQQVEVPQSIRVFAGFWRRFAAYQIDSALLLPAAFALDFILTGNRSGEDETTASLAFFSVVGWWLYNAIMESSPYQATAGKLALRIKVTDRAGKRIGFGRATGRHFAEILSSLTLGIGFVMAGFTKRRQALHDMIASTLVVMKSASPATVAENPVTQTLPAWGIGALVVAGSLVPIGIVAAIAIPAYQDYTIRAQISEGLSLAAEYKAAVAEAALSGLQWEDINSGVNGFPVARSEKYIKSVEIVSGVVLVTYGQSASADIAGTVLALIPGITDSNELIWVCGYARAPDGAALVLQEHEQYSDVAERYLPAACRSG